MLFVRNHEKETDLEQMKIAYELEIDHVVSDYTDKIKQLENEVKPFKEFLCIFHDIN